MRQIEEPPDTLNGRRLYVPMRESGCGVRLAMFRDRHGERCAVGFTDAGALERVLGPGYTVLPLARRVLRELAAARGVARIQVDPVFAAAPVGRPTRRLDPQMAGALAVCAAAGAAAALLGELR